MASTHFTSAGGFVERAPDFYFPFASSPKQPHSLKLKEPVFAKKSYDSVQEIPVAELRIGSETKML
jgi:hypothetical protein